MDLSLNFETKRQMQEN